MNEPILATFLDNLCNNVVCYFVECGFIPRVLGMVFAIKNGLLCGLAKCLCSFGAVFGVDFLVVYF